jgi:hypothetical protein
MDHLMLHMILDQLNGERAVLRGPDGTQLTIPRAMWEERGRPAGQMVTLSDVGTELRPALVEPAA